MSIVSGTKVSLSALAEEHKVLLLFALWSQVLLLPQMLQITPESYKWISFIGMGGIIICGGASIINKEDELIHMISAIVTFICFTLWVILLKTYFLLPVILCLAGGKDKFKWRLEIGLITSVYLTIISSIFTN